MATIHTYTTNYGAFVMAGKQLKARESSGVVGELCVTFSFTVDEMAQIQKKFCDGETSRQNIFRAIKNALGIVASEKPTPTPQANTIDLSAVIAEAFKLGHDENTIITKLKSVGYTDEMLKPHFASLRQPQQNDILSLFK